jgi:hypothetical protein
MKPYKKRGMAVPFITIGLHVLVITCVLFLQNIAPLCILFIMYGVIIQLCYYVTVKPFDDPAV